MSALESPEVVIRGIRVLFVTLRVTLLTECFLLSLSPLPMTFGRMIVAINYMT